MKLGYPLRQFLSFQFALVAMAPMILVGLLLACFIVPKIISETENKNSNMALDLSSRVQAYLQEPVAALKAIGEMLELHEGGSRELNKVLDAHVVTNEIFEAIYLVDASGQVVSVGLPAPRQPYRDDYLGTDLSRRTFFTDARLTGKPQWSDTFLSVISGRVSVALAIPVKRQILIGEININRLSEYLRQLSAEKRVLTIIIDSQGQVIAKPNATYGASVGMFGVADRYGTVSDRPETASLPQPINIHHLPVIEKRGASATGRFSLGGEEMLGSVVKLPNPPWSVLVSEPMDVAYQQISVLGYVLSAGALLALAIALGTSLLLARRFARRFEGIAAHAGLIATGNYEAPLQKEAIVEFNDLALSLRVMADAIGDRERALVTSEAKYRDVVEGTEDLIVRCDSQGTITYANHASSRIFGVAAPLCTGKQIFDLVHPDDRTMMRHLFGRWVHGSDTTDALECRVINPAGQIRYLLWSTTIRRDEADRVLEFSSIARDITGNKHAEQGLQLASMVYQSSSEGIVVTDPANRIVAVNPAFVKMTGYSAEEVIGQTPRILKSGRHEQIFYDAMWDALLQNGNWQGELWNKRKNGELYVAWLTINTTYNDDKSVRYFVGMSSDITQRKESERLIWQQANFDAVTGLPNRNLFREHLEMEIRKAHRAGQQMALLFLDLDHFKDVNDTLGHDMGDTLLQEAAKRLRSCVRESDVVARLGGDEFTLILGELDEPADIERVAQDILQKLSEPFRLREEMVHISVSIGITFYPEDAVIIEDLLKNADQAMYAAKKLGRNRYNYFTPSMQEAAISRMRLVNDMRNALVDEQFRLHYQPIVDLATGEVHKAEALIRWEHPVRGLVSPIDFIAAAEETGLIVDIGDWAFREAARQAVHWRHAFRPEFQISINMSPVQFRSENGRRDAWFDHLQALGIPGQAVAVEITEGLLLDASQSVSSQLLAFREVGIQVAIDDFGTGYSSLSYLKKFNIDYIKIDRAFVANLALGSSDLALCEAIIVMAHTLGMKVIAEGVETNEQRLLLTAIGCNFAQGYLFSRPLPAESFNAYLSDQQAMQRP